MADCPYCEQTPAELIATFADHQICTECLSGYSAELLGGELNGPWTLERGLLWPNDPYLPECTYHVDTELILRVRQWEFYDCTGQATIYEYPIGIQVAFGEDALGRYIAIHAGVISGVRHLIFVNIRYELALSERRLPARCAELVLPVACASPHDRLPVRCPAGGCIGPIGPIENTIPCAAGLWYGTGGTALVEAGP